MNVQTLHVAALCAVLSVGAIVGCGGGGGSGSNGVTGPALDSINGATSPVAIAGATIELRGSTFGSTPNLIRFRQGAGGAVDVAPVSTAAWTDTSIRVTVPVSTFAVPGSVQVSVLDTLGRETNTVTLALTVEPAFTAQSITWGSTTAMPFPTRAHGASAARVDSTNGWIYAIGGNDGTATIGSVIVASIDNTASLGGWAAANPLPNPRAFPAIARAHEANSPVGAGQTVIYAIGGHAGNLATPNPTTDVYVGTVVPATGQINWSTSSVSLPAARLGAGAVVENGYLHVTGGIAANGSSTATVFTAQVTSNGSLGPFTTSASMPIPVGFHGVYSYAGRIYAIGGQVGAGFTDIFSNSTSQLSTAVQFATVQNGVVGTWAQSTPLNPGRANQSVLGSFRQVLQFEGVVGAANEGEQTAVGLNGALAAFSDLSGTALPAFTGGGTVFNGAGVTSPVLASNNTPRFLLLGGDTFANPGNLTNQVLATTGP